MYKYDCRSVDSPSGETTGGKSSVKLSQEIVNSVKVSEYEDSYSLTYPLNSLEKMNLWCNLNSWV